MTTWDPHQYERFDRERLRPAFDLLAQVDLDEPSSVVDLGCGAGALAALLAARWPAAEIVGVDSSPEMLAVARDRHPGLAWHEGDVSTWSPDRPPDVLASNAALHWVGDHRHLFPRLLRLVEHGGVLAVQMPGNWDAPSHTIAAEVAALDRWRERLLPRLLVRPVLDLADYYDLLTPLAETVDVWSTTYGHVLTGPDPVAEWTKGTLLGPLLAALDEREADDFLAAYRAATAQAYPRHPDGTTLFWFRRLFVVARRA